MSAVEVPVVRAVGQQVSDAALIQRQIEAAETAHAREIEALATETTAAPAAVTALRSRILARFTELEDERAAITAQLAKLDLYRQPAPDLDLLNHGFGTQPRAVEEPPRS